MDEACKKFQQLLNDYPESHAKRFLRKHAQDYGLEAIDQFHAKIRKALAEGDKEIVPSREEAISFYNTSHFNRREWIQLVGGMGLAASSVVSALQYTKEQKKAQDRRLPAAERQNHEETAQRWLIGTGLSFSLGSHLAQSVWDQQEKRLDAILKTPQAAKEISSLIEEVNAVFEGARETQQEPKRNR